MAQRVKFLDQARRFFAEAWPVPAWLGRMDWAKGFRNRVSMTSLGSTSLLTTPDDALKIAAVWRCVNIVSNAYAMLPWQVFRRDKSGDGERQANHPAEWVLSHRANPEMSAFDFRRTIKQHALLWGNGYAEIIRDTAGRIAEMWLLDPSRVTPGRNGEGKLVYRVLNDGGQTVIMRAADMFHLKGASPDGVTGYSILEVGAGSLSTSVALDQSLGQYFRHGFRPMGFLKTKGKLSLEGLQKIEEKIAEFSQTSKRWSALPLDQDMDFTPLTTTPEDGQIIDMRKFNVIDICRWFGVPPHLAFDLDRATFSNIDAQGQEFLTYGLMPHIVESEQETDCKLLSNGHGGLYSKINFNAIVRADLETRSKFYQVMLTNGVFSINQVLRLEDLPGIGPEGDEHVRQVQYQPLGTELTPQPVKPPAGDKPPPNDPKKANGSAVAH